MSVCWVLSCLLGFTPLFGWHNYSPLTPSNNTSSPSFILPPCTFLSVISLPFMVYFNFLGCVMAPLLVMTLIYIRIFWSLQRRLKDSSPKAQASLLREKRLACSLALVLILFAGCWIPLHLMNCLLLFQGPHAVTQGTLYAGRLWCFFVITLPVFLLINILWNHAPIISHFSRYSPVSCQLSSQPCDLCLPYPKDPAGLQSIMEALPWRDKLLP